MAMLAGYNFGPFLLIARRLAHWSQQTLGGVIGLEQSRISAIERGESRLCHIDDIASMARGLQIPPVRLNFPDISATVCTAVVVGRKDVSWVDRRDFGHHVAKLVLGIAGAAGLDLDRVLTLAAAGRAHRPRHLGAADVEVIEQLTAAFRRQDFAHGGGLIYNAAVAQFNAVLPLLDAQVAPELRPRLLLAVADLATQAGWMSFDVLDHDAARRLWMSGLDLARAAEHPLSADLTVNLLADMASQALYLQRPDEALHLVRIGQTTADGPHPVSATTSTYLTSNLAWAHAHQADAASCERALGQAVDRFGATSPAGAPAPWVVSMDGTELTAHQGHAYYQLALSSQDRHAAARAVPLLREFVDNLPPEHIRTRTLNLADLAGAHALAGDIDTAVTVGHQAADAIISLSSPRSYNRLRTLNTVLEPLHTSPDVAELRNRLDAIAA
jgi:hypothetical protein